MSALFPLSSGSLELFDGWDSSGYDIKVSKGSYKFSDVSKCLFYHLYISIFNAAQLGVGRVQVLMSKKIPEKVFCQPKSLDEGNLQVVRQGEGSQLGKSRVSVLGQGPES